MNRPQDTQGSQRGTRNNKLLDVAHVPLLEGVDEALLGRVLSAQLVRNYRHGDVIFSEGDPGDSMFAVLFGEVAISRDGVQVATRRAGDLIGEQAVLDQTVRSATLTAVGAVRVLQIPQSVSDEMAGELRPFTRNLIRVLSSKLRQATEDRAFHYAQEQALFGEFRAHVSPEVLNLLLSEGAEEYMRPRFEDLVILITDVRDFTQRSAGMEAADIAEQLGAYLDAVVDIVHRHGGVVDKFIGDAVLAFWGGFAPTGGDLALQAFRCAEEMVRAAAQMDFGGGPIRIGVGLNAGRVFVGNIGGDGKRQFTVLGPAVNAAARLEAQSKELGVPIVAGEALSERLPEEVRGRLRAFPGTELKGVGSVTCYGATVDPQENVGGGESSGRADNGGDGKGKGK